MAITQIEIFLKFSFSLSVHKHAIKQLFKWKQICFHNDSFKFFFIYFFAIKKRERERQRQRNALSISTQEKAVEIKLGLIWKLDKP